MKRLKKKTTKYKNKKKIGVRKREKKIKLHEKGACKNSLGNP